MSANTEEMEELKTPSGAETADAVVETVCEPIAEEHSTFERYGGKKNMIFFILYMAGNLILANFLFIICCIPVITIGASLAALNKTVYKIFDETDVSVIKTFFKTFAKNFGQATGVWLIFSTISFFAGFGIYYCFTHEATALTFVFLGLGVLVFWMVGNVMAYVFILIPRYNNRFLAQITNAFFIGFSNVGWTIIIWIAWILGVGVFIAFFPSSFIYAGWVVIVCLFSLLVLIACPIYRHIFYKLEQKDTTDTDLY